MRTLFLFSLKIYFLTKGLIFLWFPFFFFFLFKYLFYLPWRCSESMWPGHLTGPHVIIVIVLSLTQLWSHHDLTIISPMTSLFHHQWHHTFMLVCSNNVILEISIYSVVCSTWRPQFWPLCLQVRCPHISYFTIANNNFAFKASLSKLLTHSLSLSKSLSCSPV